MVSFLCLRGLFQMPAEPNRMAERSLVLEVGVNRAN